MPTTRILCLGDIVGRPGRQVVHQKLPGLVRQHNVNLVIANGENIAGGLGDFEMEGLRARSESRPRFLFTEFFPGLHGELESVDAPDR